jgi:Tol biopolymer transport system component
LAQCLVEIRRALDDDTQQLIRTVARRGYVFASPVTTPVVEFPRQAGEPGPLQAAPSPAARKLLNRPIVKGAFVLAPVLMVTGFFAWQAFRKPPSAEPPRAVALTTFPGVELYPSLSPDGAYVAFMWTGSKQDNLDIYVQMIGSGSPLRLTADLRADYNPVWSPDGRWIAFLRAESTSLSMQPGKSELRLIPPLGGPERKLAEVRAREVHFNPAYLAWCPDSNCLVVTDSPGEGKPDALFVVSLETGEKRQLTDPQPPVLDDTNPAVSPDGRSLVFRREVGYAAAELHSLPLGEGLTAAGGTTRLTAASLNAAFPAWMPDGKEILFSAQGSLWRVAVSGESTPARLPFVGEDGLMPVVSRPLPGRPARLVYARSFDNWNIWRVETAAPGAPASSPPNVAIASTRRNTSPQFSPDGRRVAFTSNRTGAFEIWLADPDGSGAVQLTSMRAGTTGSPRWSPDGQMIVFDSNPEGQYEIYAISAAGGKARRLTYDPASDHVPSFSRDGKWVYFTSNRTGADQIWKVSVSGGKAVQVTHNVGSVAFESADGAYLYYTQTHRVPSPLWRLPIPGGEPVKVLDGIVWRAFAPVERGIYYIDQNSGRPRLQFFDFTNRESNTVSRDLGELRTGLTASPDGRTVLFSRVDSSVDDLMLVENFR